MMLVALYVLVPIVLIVTGFMVLGDWLEQRRWNRKWRTFVNRYNEDEPE